MEIEPKAKAHRFFLLKGLATKGKISQNKENRAKTRHKDWFEVGLAIKVFVTIGIQNDGFAYLGSKAQD